MTEQFIDTGKEDRNIRFSLFCAEDGVRILCNGHLIDPSGGMKYTFPAGIIRLEVYERGNYQAPFLSQSAFFSPGWCGSFFLKNGRIQVFPDESLTVLPEKGHFRVINFLKEPVSVRRMGGTEIFTDALDVTPYRLAGAGRYRLQFFSGKEKIGERELLIKEGTRGSILVKKEKIEYLEEFSI